MIRLILIVIYLVFFGVFSLIALPLLALLGKFKPLTRDKLAFRFVTDTFRVIRFLAGAKVTVIGKERIPDDSAVLYIGNHRGFFDIIILYTLVPGLTGFVAKEEIKKVPILNLWMVYMNCLFLNRKDVREGLKTILEGIEKMKSGISMCIFPEGTRSKGESEVDMLPFKEGSFKLAEKSGCPIVPVALRNTANCLEKQFPRIHKTHVTVEFGEPIYMNELEKEDKKFIGAYTRNIIIDMLKSSI